ncbi:MULTISPECIES: DKNYY domain-containing protein [Fusobacterium]|uniref:DKNYY domain-containing protein n=1 Tax=Fusobacterium TaxID=848 RepID=UPI0022E1D30C|nr:MULTISPECIES: DKNYY domain-containing protein [Fusobacterium]
MKTNNLDDLFKKKKTSNTSFYLKITIIVFAMLVLFFIPFFISNWINADNNTYEIKTNGEQYEKGNFFKYQGKIYVFTLNDGMQELKNVDIATFKPFEPEDYFTQNIALDKNSVYFGNVIIPDLNPNKLKVIGNGYYTDGTNTYFYSPFSEFDKDSSKYIYPYKKMENVKNLKALKDFELFAVDGENVYYKGEILKNADLNTLEIIDRNNEYFADKENVYYKSKLLPIKNSGKLKIVSSEQGDTFLYDEVNGYVFIGDYSFDKEKAPYKVIGNNGNTLYNLIFVAKDGIYYYDSEKKKQLKAGDNIFIGNIEEINPNIFTDDENIYYFSAYSVRSGSRKNHGELISRNTDIYYLDKKDGWEKIKDIKEGSIGSIWKKENKYYYFNNLGIFHFTDDAIYEISDKETLNYLLTKADDETDDIKSEGLTAINTDYIEELIKNEKLIAVSGEKKMTIAVKYKTDIVNKIFKYSIRISLVVYLIFFIFKNFRKSRRISNESK